MKELLIMLAEALPFDEQIKMLKEGIEKYQSDPSEENKNGVYMHCMLLSAKEAGEKLGGSDNLIKQMDLNERANKLLIPGEQC